MAFLLDNSALSELRRGGCHPSLREWHRRARAVDLFVPAIVVAEIEMGIVKARQERRTEVADTLDRWLRTKVLLAYEVVPFGRDAALVWAGMRMTQGLKGGNDNFDRDMMIAATALAEGMSVVTRNREDFVRIAARYPDLAVYDPTSPEHLPPGFAPAEPEETSGPRP